MKIPNIFNKEKIKAAIAALKNVPWALGERVFPFFLVMIFLAVFAGATFFFKFVVLDQQRKEPGVSNGLPVFREQKLDDIVAIWAARLERFQAADSKDYPDIFSPRGE